MDHRRDVVGTQEVISIMPLSNQPSASTIASSVAAENGGISQSTSHPSIPSVESGASSVYPEGSSLASKTPLAYESSQTSST